ncbi:MAG: molybdopterin dinucleotide binding domain-containing protein [Thermodesulfobacteriota bacterium]|nr:molybdopterin dinucleotide binding domain-containing protein [Thermodesulfobacteriota bacterium]
MDSSANKQQQGPFYIVTYRDIFQTVVKEKASFNADYQERSAIALMFPGDMKALKIKSDSRLRLRNSFGMVVVRAKACPDCQKGIIYMPFSPYSNVLANYDPGKAKLPDFKMIEVEVEPAEEEITPVSELIKSLIRQG